MEALPFLQRLWCGYPEAFFVELRFILPRHLPIIAPWYTDEKGKEHRSTSRFFRLGSEGIVKAAQEVSLWKEQCNVYMGILPRRLPRGIKENVTLARCLFAEIDGGSEGVPGACRLLKKAVEAESIFPPHMVVQSGGGIHIYWFLSEVFPLTSKDDQTAYTLLLKRLCDTIGNVEWHSDGQLRKVDGNLPHPDPICTNSDRIFRVPGTPNHKPGRKPVKALRLPWPDAPRLTFDQWDHVLKDLPRAAFPQEQHLPGHVKMGVDVPRKIREDIETHWPLHQRYPELRRCLYSLRKWGHGQSSLEVHAALFAFHNPGCDQHVLDELVRSTMNRVLPG